MIGHVDFTEINSGEKDETYDNIMSHSHSFLHQLYVYIGKISVLSFLWGGSG